MDLENAIDFLKQIMMAFNELWSYEIIHRDIKPQNILIKKDYTVVVADFGLATIEQSITQTKIGKFIYLIHVLQKY